MHGNYHFKRKKTYQKTRRPEPDMALHTWVSDSEADLKKSQNPQLIKPIFDNFLYEQPFGVRSGEVNCTLP